MENKKTRIGINLGFRGIIKITDAFVTTDFGNVEFVAGGNEVVKTKVSEFTDEEFKSAVITLIQGRVLNGFDGDLTYSEVAALIVKEFRNREVEVLDIAFDDNVEEELKKDITAYIDTLGLTGKVVAKHWSKGSKSRIYINKGSNNVGMINL